MHYPDIILAGIAIFLLAYLLYPAKKAESAIVAISITAMYFMVIFITIGLHLRFFS